MTVAGRLREVRDYLCLTLEEAATAAGLEPARLAAIETGEIDPDELELGRLARAYDHPPGYFRTGPTTGPAAVSAGSPRLIAELTAHDRHELDRFTAFLRDTAGY